MSKPRSWAIYGKAGTGKTTFAATFPTPILFLDIKDEGIDSIADVSGVKVLEVEEWSDIEDAYWYLHANPGKFKTVVFDTVTQLQQLVVEEVGAKKASSKDKQPGDWGSMTKQDWGEVASRLKSWLVNFRDLDMEVVFLAQDRVFNVEEEEGSAGEIDPEVGPRLSPSVTKALCAAVSVVGNTFIRSREEKKKVRGRTVRSQVIEYCMRLGPNPYYTTKIRKPKAVELPEFVSDPTYNRITSLIEEK